MRGALRLSILSMWQLSATCTKQFQRVTNGAGKSEQHKRNTEGPMANTK
jgi:hypothetical protein